MIMCFWHLAAVSHCYLLSAIRETYSFPCPNNHLVGEVDPGSMGKGCLQERFRSPLHFLRHCFAFV